jgi:hypothetical protein
VKLKIKIYRMKVHLINKQGDRIEIDSCDFPLCEKENHKYASYDIDIDWYLSNGYMTLEDMRKSIEGDMCFM